MLRSGVARVVTSTSRCFTAKATEGKDYHGTDICRMQWLFLEHGG